MESNKLKFAIALLLIVSVKTMLPNQTPGFVPQNGGVWRGATHWKWNDTYDYDPQDFKQEFGRDLHIYRTFKSCWKPGWKQAELDFVAKGGIIFWSIQSKAWAKDTASPKHTACLKEMATAVKQIRPTKFFMCPGYEPDSHATPYGGSIFGTVDEYLAYRKKVKDVFDAEGVDNAIYVMDYSNHGPNHPGVFEKQLADLFPADGTVQFLFFNIFQMYDKKKYVRDKRFGRKYKNWDSRVSFEWFYKYFSDETNPKHKLWKDIPWGVGAWGTRQMDPMQTRNLKIHDRKTFIDHLTEDIESGKYPKIKAAIWFDSLECIITKEEPKNIRYYNKLHDLSTPLLGSAMMMSTITRYLHNSKFD